MPGQWIRFITCKALYKTIFTERFRHILKSSCSWSLWFTYARINIFKHCEYTEYKRKDGASKSPLCSLFKCLLCNNHDAVIKWKHFTRYWPFVRGIHRWPVNSPHKGQWRGALIFSMICTWINGWVNDREAGRFKTPSCPLWRHCNG